ncbi:DUF397 domain-containing protein [Actinomadura craniellae]|uniref:DUF397 domain-containing protein n=1 Tax=Actinomadura craniellae TaxID=2231787 RepID=A0A365GY63_9ACTN|nr:DUF397 domain-containing protein [Actinomadura craniellae]RAY11756.1 DUF397 domain-containing protein [Actinomadura craniellae]
MDLSAAQWRKSSRSGSNGGDCVEVAALPGGIAVRDSRDPSGPALTFSRTAFRAFARAITR